jgi:outer membrane protein assembly factor BamD (BamD/ComL family)
MENKNATTPWKATISGGAMGNSKLLKVLVTALALLLSTLMVRDVHGQTTIVIKADDQFQFAQRYFEKEEYYRAVGEYERFIYFFPQDPRVALARYKIGLSYLNGERFTEAVQAFDAVIEKHGNTDLATQAYFKMSESYVKLKQFGKALTALKSLIKQCSDLNVKDQAHYKQGWINLEMDEWEKAQASFDKISSRNRDTYRLKQLSEDINKREFLKIKNPATAGWLAVIPGAGHLYCERYRDALIAFLLNGAMIYAAYEAFDHDNEGLGGLITFFEIGLYGGNIYSAVNSAHNHNRKQKKDFFQYLKDHSMLQASAMKLDKAQALTLSYKITF